MSALQTGEADWWECASVDLLDAIKATPDVVVRITDPTEQIADLRLNRAIPPSDNPDIRRALLPAVDQQN